MPDHVLVLADGLVDLDEGEVRRRGTRTRLGRRECELLAALARGDGRTLSRESLLAEVWGRDRDDVSRVVDVTVTRLRTRLGPMGPVHVRTVAGEGYRFAPVEEVVGSRRGLWALPDGTLDLVRHEVCRAGQVTPLTGQESRILTLLTTRRGQPVTRDEVLRVGWGQRSRDPGRKLDAATVRLRRKLEADPSRPRVLVTVRGVGWRLEVAPGVTEAPAPLPVDLIGRDADLVRLESAMSDHPRVVVLGPAGVGKTALVQAWLARRRGVYVDLQGVDPLRAITVALAGGEASDLRASLSSVDGEVIVLDHADDHLPWLEREIPSWPATIRAVLLSRTRPRDVPHHLLRLEPLPVGALDTPGVILLVRRAREAGASLVVDASSAPGLLAAAAAVDGLPLGLELAAGWLRLVSPQQLEAHLGHQDSPLAVSVRTTWRLLPDHLQILVAELAIFEGPFTFGKVLQVVGSARFGGPVGLGQALNDLVDHSVLRVQDASSRRMVLYRSFRVVALPSTPRETRGAHLAWAVELSTPAARPGGPLWTSAMAEELPELVAALATARDRCDLAATAILTLGIGSVRLEIGQLVTGLAEVERALDELDDLHWRLRLEALAGELLVAVGRPVEAIERLTAILPEPSGGHDPVVGELHCQIAIAQAVVGSPDAGEAHLSRGLVHLEACGAPDRLAWALGEAAALDEVRGDFDAAEVTYRRAVRLAEISGATRRTSALTHNLAGVLLKLGRLDETRTLCTQAVELDRRLGLKRRLAVTEGNLGRIASAEGRPDEAAACFAAARRGLVALGATRQALMFGLNETGAILDAGRPERARTLALDYLAEARRFGAAPLQAVALDYLGRSLLAKGEAAPAQRHLDDAVGLTAAAGWTAAEGAMRGALAVAMAMQGRHDDAQRELDHAAPLLAGCSDAERLRFEGHAIQAEILGGRVREASARLAHSAALAKRAGLAEPREIREARRLLTKAG